MPRHERRRTNNTKLTMLWWSRANSQRDIVGCQLEGLPHARKASYRRLCEVWKTPNGTAPSVKMISRAQDGANMTTLIVHLNLNHESCPNSQGELAAGQKSLCLSVPDWSRAVERPLSTVGRAAGT